MFKNVGVLLLVGNGRQEQKSITWCIQYQQTSNSKDLLLHNNYTFSDLDDTSKLFPTKHDDALFSDFHLFNSYKLKAKNALVLPNVSQQDLK